MQGFKVTVKAAGATIAISYEKAIDRAQAARTAVYAAAKRSAYSASQMSASTEAGYDWAVA